jgi:recombination protein RecT
MNAPAATQLRTVATTMTGQEMAAVAKQTAQQVGTAMVKKFFEANRPALMALLPKHFEAERMLKLALGSLRTTPKLAQASMESLLGAVVTCAQLGLEPNTPLGHAYLLPFDKRERRGDQWVTAETQVQVIIGYKGMLDLARRSGQIVSIAAHEVCEKDEFRFAYGLDEDLTHRPALAARGNVIGFYAVAKLTGGGYSFEFMSVDEVNAIRDKAAEKNRAKKDKDVKPILTGPWADNYIEMGRKTVLRRLFKYLPISIENLAFATEIDGHAIKQANTLEEIAFDVALEDNTPASLQITDQHETGQPRAMDPETGEVLQTESTAHEALPGQPVTATGKPASMTYAEVADQLHKARTQDELDLAGDPIRSVPDLDHQNELGGIFKARMAELNEANGQKQPAAQRTKRQGRERGPAIE